MTSPTSIVTGAVGGIGRGICAVLEAAGHTVIRVDAHPDLSGPPMARLDITDSVAVDELIDEVVADHGHIDGLVNNAAVGPLGTVPDTDDALLDAIVDTNVKGTFIMSRAVLRHMIPRRAGSIVNIGSGAAYGKPNMAAYAASKAAVHALTAAMAHDHFADHIRVNTVIPGGGGIPTGISLERFGGSAAAYAALPHPGSVAGRTVTPEDVGHAVEFLLGERSATISGTVIDVGCLAGQGGDTPRMIAEEQT